MTEIVAADPIGVRGDPDVLEVVSPQSPAVVFWTQMRKSPLAIAGGVVLTIFYLLALFAPFVAPYPQEEMDRAKYFHPPQALHWVRADGSFSLRPYVREMRRGRHEQLRVRRGPSARDAGASSSCAATRTSCSALIPSNVHLFGVDRAGARVSVRQ